MRPGGGAAKGANFERKICKDLSLWLSGGQFEKLFNRNVLSGGSFTVAVSKGASETGQPGDLAAAHPLAYEFLQHFLIECKHKRDLNLSGFVRDYTGKSFLAKTIDLAKKQAGDTRQPLIIAAENYQPTLLLMPREVGYIAVQVARPSRSLRYHIFHNDSIMLVRLDNFLDRVHPERFLQWYKLPKGSN